jgi:hypothetical protein
MTGSGPGGAKRKLMLTVALGLGVGLILAFFVAGIAALGHRIPSPHLLEDYFVALLWCIGIAFYICCLPVSKQERSDLLLLWGARCGVTLLAMLFYEANYPLDAYTYYRSALAAGVDWSLVAFGKGTDNTQALSWLMNRYLPIFDSYHGLKVCFSFLGFLGSFVAYRAFAPFCGEGRRKLLYLMFLFPSVVFWSSILGKDPVIFLGISLYVYGTVRFVYDGSLMYLFPLVSGILLAGAFRSWYLPILTLPLAIFGISGIKRTWLKYAFLGAIVAGVVYSAQMFADQFELASVEDLVGRTQTVSHSWNRGGSANIAPMFSGVVGMLKFAPVGMFTALFRPLPGEVMNPFGLLAGFENFFLLGFVLRAMSQFGAKRSKLKEPIVQWAIMLILVWSFIYGFVSFQNLGSGARFKLQILPVMLCLLVYLDSGASQEEPL